MRNEHNYIESLRPMLDTVYQIREMAPGIGCYKLWLMVSKIYPDRRLPGRDAFLNIMRTYGLVLKRPRPRHTTNSNHRFHKYKNLIRDYIPTAPNRLWVSDITYIDTEEGYCYLHMVTDAYSRKILGWCVSPTLEARYTLAALKLAIYHAKDADFSSLIHHSDRGVQYCCDAYVNELTSHNISISMTEDYKPTDNAIAERINGTIKTEVIYRIRRFRDITQAKERIGRYIDFYNDKRPHASIGMKVPCQVHLETGPQKKMWKTKRTKNTFVNKSSTV